MLNRCFRLIKFFPKVPRFKFSNNEKFEIPKEDLLKLKEFYESGMDMATLAKHKDQFTQEVFKEREQIISFKLMTFSEIHQVFQLYSDELVKQLKSENPESPFTTNELSLFLYFTSCLRGEEYAEQMKQHEDRFQQITSKILLSINELDPQQFCAFVWSLSTYQIELGTLNLNDSKQYIIKQYAELIMQKIPPETLASFAFAIKNIIKDNSQLLLKISTLIQQNISLQTPHNLITMLQCLPEHSFTNSRLIFEHVKDLYEQDLLSLDQFLLVLVETMRITKYESSKFLFEMFDAVATKLDSSLKHQLDVQMQRVIDVLLGCIQVKSPECERIIREMLRICHAKGEKLNITEYVSLFLAVAKLKNSVYDLNLEKTVKILIELSTKSQIFHINDLEQKELVQIIVASAALRLDHKDFIRNIISRIEPTALHKQDLLLLAKSFIIYIRQFESECLIIHQVCESRKLEFDSLEQAQLMQTFNRIKILIPDSSFFK